MRFRRRFRCDVRAAVRRRYRGSVFVVATIVAVCLAAPTVPANEWTNLNSSQAGSKDGQMMAYDAQSNRVVMFGDHTNSFDPQTWNLHHVTVVNEDGTSASPASWQSIRMQ